MNIPKDSLITINYKHNAADYEACGYGHDGLLVLVLRSFVAHYFGY